MGAHVPRRGDTLEFTDLVQKVPEGNASHELSRKLDVVPIDDHGNPELLKPHTKSPLSTIVCLLHLLAWKISGDLEGYVDPARIRRLPGLPRACV